ncbi:hypothetical protein POTOM_050785 [Populus tomentosa]|uniref:Uncharacterized protein n=1 Tax=Populus tomentosa TaxID=118781 RepID=A0A8X8C8D0_POPTO|nr:hypothetical protein POTOM_050785 [Populus tomentosa]
MVAYKDEELERKERELEQLSAEASELWWLSTKDEGKRRDFSFRMKIPLSMYPALVFWFELPVVALRFESSLNTSSLHSFSKTECELCV